MHPLKVNRGEYTSLEYIEITRSIAQKLSNKLKYPLTVCSVIEQNDISYYITEHTDKVRLVINDWVKVYFAFMVIPDDI